MTAPEQMDTVHKTNRLALSVIVAVGVVSLVVNMMEILRLDQHGRDVGAGAIMLVAGSIMLVIGGTVRLVRSRNTGGR